MADQIESDYRSLVMMMGMTLIAWTSVEDALYDVFGSLLQSPNKAVCSAIFFGPPSFEGKRTLVDKVAQAAWISLTQKIAWIDLNKRLKGGSEQRGKVAHYALHRPVLNNDEFRKAMDTGRAIDLVFD